jgi:hypothetical protein
MIALAIMLQACLPSLGFALMHTQSQRMAAVASITQVICGSGGSRVISLASKSSDDAAGKPDTAVGSIAGKVQKSVSTETSPESHSSPCPFCQTAAAPPALPAAETCVLLLPRLGESWPDLFYHAASPLFQWAVPLSRAPPL